MSIGVLENQDQGIFQQIFNDWWEEFKKKRPKYNTAQYNDPVSKMLGCGQEFSGYSEYCCFYCGMGYRRVAFSCKSPFCFSCSKAHINKIVNQVSQSLHSGVAYRQLVLTVPEQLRQRFYDYRLKGNFLSSFMRLGYDFVEKFINDIRHQSMKVGCTVVLHTHGRSGGYNPHLHLILGDGGINLKTGKWVELGNFSYDLLHKRWQSFLLKWLPSQFGEEITPLVKELQLKYLKGFVAHVSKGNLPKSCRGLARYLARYIASPPISVKRILDYNGEEVKYWYNDHKTKMKKVETVPVLDFIGRMVQHIVPKCFHRVRYYGLQATKTLQKWKEALEEGLGKIGRFFRAAFTFQQKNDYRSRYKEVTFFDPLICPECGAIMELSRMWHPKYGTFFDLIDTLPIVPPEIQSNNFSNSQKNVGPSVYQSVLPGMGFHIIEYG